MAETMRDRLSRVKESSPWVRKPLSEDELRPEPGAKRISPESVFMKKVEKVMKKHDETKKRMLSDSGQYLSLYHELKRAEQDFLFLYEDKERTFLDLPEVFEQKMDTMWEKVQGRKK
jgi:hypothetical protein